TLARGPKASAILRMTPCMILQGPQVSDQKSMITGTDAATTSSPKLASVNSASGIRGDVTGDLMFRNRWESRVLVGSVALVKGVDGGDEAVRSSKRDPLSKPLDSSTRVR